MGMVVAIMREGLGGGLRQVGGGLSFSFFFFCETKNEDTGGQSPSGLWNLSG